MKNLLLIDTVEPARSITYDNAYKRHRILLNGYINVDYMIQSMKKNL